MSSLQRIYSLFKKDILMEFRQRAAINGILLYVVSTVFVAYLAFNSIEELSTWLALFWIILLFGATNAAINSFRAESGKQYLYYYSLCSPQEMILSKLLYNTLLILLLALLTFGIYSLLLGNPIEEVGIFMLGLVLGSLGLASTLTLIAAIASRTGNNSTLVAILGFPVLLPLLMTAIRVSLLSGIGMGWDVCGDYLMVLFAINAVTIGLSYVLFQYLWRG